MRFDHRIFPLELFNSQATPRNELEPEMPVCASLAPQAGWQAWSAPEWEYPATMLPAMEAVQAARLMASALALTPRKKAPRNKDFIELSLPKMGRQGRR